jgi:hypothetical protein
MSTPFGGFTQIGVGPIPIQVCPPLGQGQSVTIYNQDLANIVTLGTSNNISQNASDGVPLQPLTPGTFPAVKALYAVAPQGTASLVIIPQGGTLSPSPAQIAAQIAAQGLATAANQIGQNTTIPANIQTMGAPPYVPNILSVSGTRLTAAGSPYTLITFGAKSRIWYAVLSLAVATDTVYAGGLAGIFSQMQLGSGPVLLASEAAIGGPGQNSSNTSVLSMGGIIVNAADTLVLNVNNGTSITDCFIRVSIVALYTTP